jgi:HSP20 family molecular chaperone IbpA
MKNQGDFVNWKSFADQIIGENFVKEFLPDGFSGAVKEPQYNLYRSSSEIFVLVNLPFIKDISQVKLLIKERELYLKGHIDFGYDHLDVVHEEMFAGGFEKRISLPEEVNTKKVNAYYKRGILQVQLYPRLHRGERNVSIRDL